MNLESRLAFGVDTIRTIKGIRIDRKKLRGYKWRGTIMIRKYIRRRNNAGNCCGCVNFRLDDVGSDLVIATTAVMDTFLAKNHCLSLGLVMNPIGADSILLEKIFYGSKIGLFELVLHGWDHVDYSKLSEIKQQESLFKASEKMQNLFGKVSKVFIPPYGSFNASTLQAMNKVGITTISSLQNYEVEKDIFKTAGKRSGRADANSIYHLPETAGFERWNGHGLIRVPINRILNNIDLSINQYGYAVVTLHPVTFLKLQDGNSIEVVDEHQVNDLKTLIDCIESKNISITSFSNILGTQP